MSPTLATITKPPFWNWALFNFSCTFPNLSFLQKYWDLGEMTLILCLNFYLKVFCPLFIVMACRVFWDWPFCKFVAMHWAAEFKVQCLETRVQCQVLVTASWSSCPVFFMVDSHSPHTCLLIILFNASSNSAHYWSCNHLNRGCWSALIGVPSMSSTTSLIMMASDNVWDEEVALIGGGMLNMTDCCVDLGVKKLVICCLWYGRGVMNFPFACTITHHAYDILLSSWTSPI